MPLKRDENRVTVLGGVTDDSNQTVQNLLVNPTTKRLKVSATVAAGIVTSINTDNTPAQTITVGTTGSDVAIVDNGTGDHKINIPTASAVNRGALSSADWSTFNAKQPAGSYEVTTNKDTDGTLAANSDIKYASQKATKTYADTKVATNSSASLLDASYSKAAGNARYTTFKTGNSNRWELGANATAESGGNAGSDFVLNRYNDAGAYVDSPLIIARSSGVITPSAAISGSVTGNSGTVTGATFTKNLTVNGGNTTITGNADNTSALTVGSGAVSVSGTNTGDVSVATGAEVNTGTDNVKTVSAKAIADSFIKTSIVPTGTILEWSARISPTGFLNADGSAVSRSTYATLFSVIVPTRGEVTISIATPGVVTLSTHGLVTGDAIYLTTTGALPTGLTANTLYYVVKVDANTFSLATSRTNAFAGTKINTSGSQSGTHTLYECPYGLGDGSTTFNVPNRVGKVGVGMDTSDTTDFTNLGKTGGEKTHLLTSGESGVPAHHHASTGGQYFAEYGSGYTINAPGGSNLLGFNVNTADNSAANASSAHNNIQPYVVTNYIIKT